MPVIAARSPWSSSQARVIGALCACAEGDQGPWVITVLSREIAADLRVFIRFGKSRTLVTRNRTSMPKRAATLAFESTPPTAVKRPRTGAPSARKPARAQTTRPAGSARSSVPQPLRLPFENVRWSDADYVAPIAFLRSALFGIVPKGRRRRLDQEPLATLGAFQLRYTGEMLDQFDEDVWLVMLRQAREHGMGPNVHFTLRSLLKELTWDPSGKSTQRLRASFIRLASATVEIESSEFHYVGHLVEEVVCDKTNDEQYYFRLSPRMATLFGPDQYAYLGIRERTQIKGLLAKWLHGYIESNPLGFPAHVDDLRRLSGSTAAERYRFTANLRDALTELQHCGVVESWRVERTAVFVRRSAERQAKIAMLAAEENAAY